MPQTMTIEEFGQSIKSKYPEFKDVPDGDLGKEMLKKYPIYRDRVIQPVEAPTAKLETNKTKEKSWSQKVGQFTLNAVAGPVLRPLVDQEFRSQVTDTAKDVIKPIAQTAIQLPRATVAGAYGLLGNEKAVGEWTKPTNIPFLGEVKALSARPGDVERYGAQTPGQTAGQALEMAATVVPGGATAKTARRAATVGGALYGAGAQMQNTDATAGDVLGAAALGGLTGWGVTTAVPAARFLKRKLLPGTEIEMQLTKGIRPSKNNIGFKKDLGSVLTELQPESARITDLKSLDAAIKGKKIQIWGEVNDALNAAGQDASIDISRAAQKIKEVANRPIFKIKNQGTADKLIELANSLENKKLTPFEAEAILEDLNAAEQAYYKKNLSNRSLAEKADPELAADLHLAATLREELDSKLAGFGDLKKRYGALSNVGKEVSGRIPVAERANFQSLAEQISAARTAGNMAGSVLTGNWGNAMGQALDYGTAKVLGHLEKSDTKVASAFKKLSKKRAKIAPQKNHKTPTLIFKTTQALAARKKDREETR